jgi:hypothetical protein
VLKTANKLYQQISLDVFKDKKALRIYLVQLRRMLIDMYHLSINKFSVIDLRKKLSFNKESFFYPKLKHVLGILKIKTQHNFLETRYLELRSILGTLLHGR